ncbi:MAG: PDZ domain-containing protein [Planctomycetes bacterium]|nr:PDZ domain-containing protein [Planctomycetota bacterium]
MRRAFPVLSATLALLALLVPGAALRAADATPPAPATTTPLPGPDRTPRPVFGIVPDDNASIFDATGLAVQAVNPGSTAASFGVLAGDVIKTFNGQAITTQADLAGMLGKLKVGDTVTVEIARKTGDKVERKSMSGPLRPALSAPSLGAQIAKVREAIERTDAALKEGAAKKQISLAEMLRQLKDIEEAMPAAVAEFKKQYPNGDFTISIKIDIVSDKTSKQPVEVGNQAGADLKGDKPAEPKKP